MGWMHPPASVAQQPANGYYYDGYPMAPALMSQPYHQSHLQASTPVTAAVTTSPGSDSGGRNADGLYRVPAYPQSHDFQFPCLPTSHLPPSSLASQPMPYLPINDYNMSANTNSNRMMRNLAEKYRRDKLNKYINELAALVPMVSNSPKRMDKTSVLRLSATYLRINQLSSSAKEQQQKYPQFLNTVNWSQFLLDEMDGVMLIVTTAGKIVFVSHNIEKILGHTQLELFGQSLFNITCPEDHTELKKCLTPDQPEDCTSECEFECEDSGVTSSESTVNSSCSTRSCSSRGRSNVTPTKTSTSGTSQLTNGDASSSSSDHERQRRSFYLRLRHRCLARSDQPQYELVHVLGHLRVPKKLASQAQKKSRKHKVEMATTNSNEILLVAVIRSFRERRVTEVSLMEATQDEYITRHSLDGLIMYSDHRISVVSGYLPEEVSGLQAFNFMHKDDVGWVMIALRQMFYCGESYGSSCYRLRSKTGEFIYLKTHGYLELSANTESFASFICVNTLVANEEGENEIRQMQKRFSAVVESKTEPGILAIAENQLSHDECETTHFAGTADPDKLKRAIRAMITNLPTTTTLHEDPLKSRDVQFVKAKLMSKALPPVSSASYTNIITVVQEKSPKPNSMSPQPLKSAGSGSQPSTPTSLTPTSPPVVSSRTAQNRPSVLRIAPSLASRLPVTIYNGVENGVSTTTSSNESDRDSSSEYGGRDTDSQKLDDFFDESKLTIVKQEMPDANEFDPLHTFVKQQCSERAGVVRRVDSVPPPVGDKRVGVVVRRATVKRHYDFEEASFSTVPSKKSVVSPADATTTDQQLPFQALSADSRLSPLEQQPYSHHLSSPIDDFTHLPTMEQSDRTIQFDDIDILETKPEPEMLQLLDSTNIKLESRMHLQGAQINDIEGDLDKVPFTPGSFYLQTGLGKLKEQHSQQEKMLKSLQKDHHSLQNCSVDRNISNIRHNFGV